MAKSFKDFVQDSPRTGLSIPVKTKNLLFRTNTPPADPTFGFKLHGRLVSAWSRVRLCRHTFTQNPHLRKHARPAKRLTTPTRGAKKDPSPERHGQPIPPGTQDHGCRHRSDFLLSLVISVPVAALTTPIEVLRPHHWVDEGLDVHPYVFRLEHERDHRVRSELCTHHPIWSFPCRAPPGADKECVFCIVTEDPQ